MIRGQLISEATKKPLAGYLVEVGDARPKGSPLGIRGPDKFGSGKSDTDGHFAVTIFDVPAYLKAKKGGQMALFLAGIGPAAGSVGLKAGETPTYLIPSIPGFSSPTRQ